MNIVRVHHRLSAPGFIKVAGQDEVTTTLAKMVPTELNGRVSILRTAVNNANADLKCCCGMNFPHPQGGVATTDDGERRITKLSRVLDRSRLFNDEAAEISKEVVKLIESGAFARRLEGVFSPDVLKRIVAPRVTFTTVIAKPDDVEIDLSQNPEVIVTGLVPSPDEKFLDIAKGLAKLIEEHNTKLLEKKVSATNNGKEFGQSDIDKLNGNFLKRLDAEKEIIHAQLGDCDQYSQVKDLIDTMMKTNDVLASVYDTLILTNGNPMSTVVVPNIIGGAIQADVSSIAFDEEL